MTTMTTPSPSYTSLPPASRENLNPFADPDPTETASLASISLPAYSSLSHSSFYPTIYLQIETPGKPLLSLPSPPRPDPIPIFVVPNPSTAIPNLTPDFISIRPSRSSGSCFLTSSHSSSSSSEDEYIPLSTTTYRFGPGRHPVVKLYKPGCATPTSNPLSHTPENEGTDLGEYDTFPLLSSGILTRAITFKTRLGTYTWRYASRAERGLLYPPPATPNSLLVLEKVTTVATAGGGKEKVKRTVAHFIRSEELRTQGSSASSAGNGGRLCIDVSEFDGEKGVEREVATVMVVTTALAMLKREVDRRRAQQIAVMGAIASS